MKHSNNFNDASNNIDSVSENTTSQDVSGKIDSSKYINHDSLGISHSCPYSHMIQENLNKNKEVQTEKIIQDIFDFIPSCFLKKEYYQNNSDGTNNEIQNIAKLSPADIEERIKNGKGIFYMNPCISQTLYTINKLKEEYPALSEYMNLGVEFLQFKESGDISAHAFIEIKVPSLDSIIVDYARNNDVYVYRGCYKNNTENIIPLNNTSIPSKNFNKDDNIIGIAKKSSDKLKINISDIENMLNCRTRKLCNDNVPDNFECWKQKHGNSPIYCLENGKDENGNTIRARLKIESKEPLKIFIADGEDEKGDIIWAELVAEKSYPPKISKKTKVGLKNLEFTNDFIPFLISYCK